jgi:hypothetical protein
MRLSRTLPRHHRPCAGDPDQEKRRVSPHRDGRNTPGHDVRACSYWPEMTGSCLWSGHQFCACGTGIRLGAITRTVFF